MNERIRQFVIQATQPKRVQVWDEDAHTYYYEDRHELDPEKFAELIVKDCAEIARTYDSDSRDDSDRCARFIAKEIVDRFGIK